MEKLSDYRIKEIAAGFIIEKKVIVYKIKFFRTIENEEWLPVDKNGGELFCDTMFDKTQICIYDFFNEAKAQIIKWCEEPKYHYLNAIHFPWDLSRSDIEYMAKCKAEEEKKDIFFMNEALKINPLFYKLIEKYEERIKSGWNPKTIEKPYADLVLENVLENLELTIKNKELELQLHEFKKKDNK